MTQSAAARLTGSVHHMHFITVDGERALAAARNQGIELISAEDGTALRVIAADRTATAIAARWAPCSRQVAASWSRVIARGTSRGVGTSGASRVGSHALITGRPDV